jgi:hypothetical protein
LPYLGPFVTANSGVEFEVLSVEVMKVFIFWNITPYSPYMNDRFGGTYHLCLQGKKSAEKDRNVLAGG